MTTPTLTDAGSIEEKRDAAVEALADHLDDVADLVATVRDEKYGKFSAGVDGGSYVLKHNSGDAEWFRFEADSGGETYLLSTKSDPSPAALANGLEQYDAFIRAVNNWVEQQERGLADVDDYLSDTGDALDSLDAETLLEHRDRVEQEAWGVADELAETIKSVTGKRYGTFAAEVDGTTWTLKYEENGSAKYLQVGGDYVLGRDSPTPTTLAAVLEALPTFVDAVNGWLSEQDEATQYRLTVEETAAQPDDSERGDNGGADDDNN